MGSIPVQKTLYDRILALARGERLETLLHMHVSMHGAHVIVHNGLKPIKCKLNPVNGKSKGKKSAQQMVVITRK